MDITKLRKLSKIPFFFSGGSQDPWSNKVIVKFQKRWVFRLLYVLVVLGTFQVSVNKAVTFSS